MTVNHAPPRTSRLLTAAGAAVAVSPAIFDGRAAVASGIGVFVLGGGLARGSRSAVTAGAVGLYLGILFAGLAHTHPAVLVAAAAGTVVAWDSAENAVVLYDQLSSRADARRVEYVHTAVTAGVVATAAVGGYLSYVAVTSPRPTVVVVVLLVATLLLVGVLIRR